MDMTWKRLILLSHRNSKETTKTIPSKSKFTEIPPSFNLALSLMPAGWQNTSEGCKTSACGPDTAAISGIESNKTNRLGAPLHSTVKFQDFQRLTNSLSTDFPRVHILFGQSLWHITAISCLTPLLQISISGLQPPKSPAAALTFANMVRCAVCQQVSTQHCSLPHTHKPCLVPDFLSTAHSVLVTES